MHQCSTHLRVTQPSALKSFRVAADRVVVGDNGSEGKADEIPGDEQWPTNEDFLTAQAVDVDAAGMVKTGDLVLDEDGLLMTPLEQV